MCEHDFISPELGNNLSILVDIVVEYFFIDDDRRGFPWPEHNKFVKLLIYTAVSEVFNLHNAFLSFLYQEWENSKKQKTF